ncbi:MAG: adenylate/guanylate cyclase domain-containing protein [Geminicoccaceae bacterium]
MRDLVDRILTEAATSDDLPGLIATVGDGLNARGIPVWRLSLSMRALDPMIRAVSFIWERDAATRIDRTLHSDRDEGAFRASPIAWILDRDLPAMRWRLERGEGTDEIPLLASLRERGATDYLIRVTPFGNALADVRGAAITFATDAPGGFSDDQIAGIDGLLPALGLASLRFALARVASELLGVYLGPQTAAHIRGGEVLRGRGRTITAAILLADLRGFTALAGREPPARIVAWLDQHLEAIGTPVAEHGGEVLKFLGDGLLAVFPIAGDPGDACDRALAAALRAQALTAALNASRVAAGEPGLPLDVVLHLGDVIYGNVGAARRLDFTIIGAAVNEASRIEALCGELGRSLLLSGAFARHCGSPTRSLGRFTLRGVAEPVEVAELAGNAPS